MNNSGSDRKTSAARSTFKLAHLRAFGTSAPSAAAADAGGCGDVWPRIRKLRSL